MTVTLIMIAAGFLVGICTGFIMHRSDYCMAGMFRDIFMFHSTALIKTFLLFLLISMPLFELLRVTGLVMFPFPKYGPPNLGNLLGGFLFGIGMVLAGGCAIGTLYKMGAGSLPSTLAFLGMTAGSMIFAISYPQWAVIAKSLKIPTSAITLPELLDIPQWLAVAVVSIVLILLSARWLRDGSMKKKAVVEGYLQPWKAAIALGFLAVLFLMIMGLPMGITTSNSKFAAMLMEMVAPERYSSVSFFHKNSIEYMPPLGGSLVTGGGGAAFDGVALIQFPLIIGIIGGSAFSAMLLGEWNLRFNLPWRQVVSAIIGGIIMGYASRIAPSCNLWHLYGGLPVLGLQSILFLAGMFIGSWFGSILLVRLVFRSH